MLAQPEAERDPAAAGALVGDADIAQLVGLEHEVVQPLGDRQVEQRDRMMAPVAVKERAADRQRAGAGEQPLGDTEPQHVDIEPLEPHPVRRVEHGVADPEPAGSESAGDRRGAEGDRGTLGIHMELYRVARRILQPVQAPDAARLADPVVGFPGAHAGPLDTREQGVEAFVVAAFEAERREVVGLAFGDDQSLARVVQPVAGASIDVRRGARQAEHGLAEALPAQWAPRFEDQIAQLEGRGRRRRAPQEIVHGFVR